MSMVREAFRVFDKDGSGYITLDEAKDILQRGENSISDEDLEDFFNQSDLDKDGRINYEGKYWTPLFVWLVDRYPIRDFQLHVRRSMGPQMSLNPIINFHSFRDYFIQDESRKINRILDFFSLTSF